MSDEFNNIVTLRKELERDVLLSKHHDYGPKNIADSPGGALNGLRVRLHDKLARINNLLDSGADPQHEGLIDTALDIANYGTIMALVLSGDWPGVPVTRETDPASSPQSPAGPITIGARVRVLHTPGHCWGGREGSVVSWEKLRAFPWEVLIEGTEACFKADELEVIE